MPIKVGNLVLATNKDSIECTKDENIFLPNEVHCIYQGKTISVWKKQKYYYLAFHSNSGTGIMPDQTMPCGTAEALSANLFSRIGYLFQGWNPDAEGDAVYTDRQKVTDIAGAGERLILYAIWKAITWYVKFNANGGVGSMENQIHTYDTELALSENVFTREDHEFLGWGTSPAGSVVYADRAVVKNLKGVHGAVQNLYAVWRIAYINEALKAGVTYGELVQGYRYNWYDSMYDLTNVSTITFTVNYYYRDEESNGDNGEKYYYNEYRALACVSADKSSLAASRSYLYGNGTYDNTMSGTTTLTVDVKSLTGNHYIGVGITGYNANIGEGSALEGYERQDYYAQITKVTFA